MPLAAAGVLRHDSPRGCLGKIKYLKIERAQEAVIRTAAWNNANRRADPAHPINVYRCGSCACWHIGHRPTPLERRW